jgi:hypothetical protein
MVRPYNDIRQKIHDFEMGNTHKSDFFREYTKFFIEKAKTIKTVDGEGKVNRVDAFFANPERAIAKMKEDRNLTLPIISVSIDDIDDDPERRRTDRNLEIETLWDKESQRALRVVSVAPKSVKVTFLINLWAKYVEDLNQMVEKFQLMFNPSLTVKTDFSTSVQAFLSQVSDNSSVSMGDREDRVLKKTLVVVVDAYIPTNKYLYTSTGEIETFGADVEIDENL